MYEKKTHTAQFDMNDSKDRAVYSDIVNDPLNIIVKEIKEKITEKLMDEEGDPSYIKERVVLIVTWQEKELLE